MIFSGGLNSTKMDFVLNTSFIYNYFDIFLCFVL